MAPTQRKVSSRQSSSSAPSYTLEEDNVTDRNEDEDNIPLLAAAAEETSSTTPVTTANPHPFFRHRPYIIVGGTIVAAILLLSLSSRGTTSLPVNLRDDDDISRTASVLTPIQTQVVHRHGDRTPITPLADESYWSTLLPPDDVLDTIAGRTNVVRSPGVKPHPAGGGAVFGRLTADGLDQMATLGRTLREDVERLMRFRRGDAVVEEEEDVAAWLRVASTDFSRTLQSVQGVLTGLLLPQPPTGGKMAGLRGGRDDVVVDIDARHTARMIPDPQPRLYVGQAELERELTGGARFRSREEVMRPLAVRVTKMLFDSGVLGDAALKVSFGVGEDETATAGGPSGNSTDAGSGMKPLAWNQLAEILKCLERRERLPKVITSDDLEAVAEHNAWRWFALLGDERLAPMAIKSLAKKMVLNGAQAISSRESDSVSLSPPLLHIFSGHDATLIALMCGFHIERPAVWPEYGSYLKMELLRDDADLCGKSTPAAFDGCNPKDKTEGESRYYVLFSLNGEPLRSAFGASSERADGSGRYFVPWEDILKGLDNLERGLPPLAAP